MNMFEIYQKKLNYLYEAKKILEKYGVNTRSLEVKIIKCLACINSMDGSGKEC